MKNGLPIGVFDSGIGGLTVLKSLLQAFPEERFLYLGDTARTPYGTKGAETIIRYSMQCAQFLANQGVKALVVACNTSSAYSLTEISRVFSIPVIGTVEPAVDQVLSLQSFKEIRRVGVIGTEATIASGVYREALKRRAPDLEVFEASCPLFVPLVEQGMFDGEIVEKVVELYLSRLRESRVDALVLGCTHYPLLSESILRFMGDSVSLVACSDAVAKKTEELLGLGKESLAETALQQSINTSFFVTDAEERFQKLARLFLGADVDSRRIVLA